MILREQTLSAPGNLDPDRACGAVEGGLQLDCPFPVAPDGSSYAFIDIFGTDTLPFLTEDP